MAPSPDCPHTVTYSTEVRRLAVYQADPDLRVLMEVASYCVQCYQVVTPSWSGFRVTEEQARFDQSSRARALIGSQGDWKSLGLHHWLALKRYGSPPLNIRREVERFDEAARRDWMIRKLQLDSSASQSIVSVFGTSATVNMRIVEKTLKNAPRTPWVRYAMIPLSKALEVWANDGNEKRELRRYYLTPFTGNSAEKAGFVAVTAQDDQTGEEIIFNVMPINAAYANNIRKGQLLFLAYPEEALCHHGCCDQNVDGFVARSQLEAKLRDKDLQIQRLRTAVKGLQGDVEALRAQREKPAP
ncbi:MAG: hypothetical protein KGN02_01355 [bacterium]|nr:hypothetical protein [bacterium]